MDFEAEQKRLEELKQRNFREYAEELEKPWPGMDEDLEIIFMAIELQYECGESIRLIDEWEDEDGDIMKITMPEWFMEARQEFDNQYGDVEGQLRFQKSMAVFISTLVPDYH